MTFEEAVERQRTIHARLDTGERMPEREWRSHSLQAGYEMRQVPEHGTGWYPVNVVTGEVCGWRGRWSEDGDVLLCVVCFQDGT